MEVVIMVLTFGGEVVVMVQVKEELGYLGDGDKWLWR